MESQIYNGVDTCYLPLDKRGRLPFNGHHISNEERADEKWQVSTVIRIGPRYLIGSSMLFNPPIILDGERSANFPRD